MRTKEGDRKPSYRVPFRGNVVSKYYSKSMRY